MKRLSAHIHTVLNATLIALAFACMLAGRGSLWGCVLLTGLFALLTILQSVLLREADGNRMAAAAFLLFKTGIAFAGLFLYGGLGPAFLLCAVALDLCLACPPVWAGLLTIAGAGAALAFSSAGPDAIVAMSALFVVVYLLALVMKNERALLRNTADTISSLRVSEKKLRDTNRQIELFNERLAEAARAQERSRIARGIHDTLGHTLTAIVVQLSAALEKLGRDDDAAGECVRNGRDQAKSGLASVRETIHMLDDAGTSFAEKLRRAVGIAEKSMQVQVLTVIDSEPAPAESIQQLLLSCLKEGLTNGVRHGGATAFVFRLERSGGRLSFHLEDNGAGCQTLTKGFGLTSMEEAVEQAGGTLDATGLPDGGFCLRVILPCADGNGA